MYGNGASISFAGGSSYSADCGAAVGTGTARWPFPPWRCFGLRQSDDRGGI